MALVSRALFTYTTISSGLTGTLASRALTEYFNISGYPQAIDSRALFAYLDISGYPQTIDSRALYEYLNVTPFTDPNDPIQLDLLDSSLSMEHILNTQK